MTALVDFTLEEGVGAQVEDCIRGHLENYFSRIELERRPRYSLFVDQAGGVRSVRTTNYGLTASDLREGVLSMDESGLAGRLRAAIDRCFSTFGVEPDYQLTLENR